MAQIYLNVPYKDKDSAKSLGARWDNDARQWFVPEGRELMPFSAWLAEGSLPSKPTEVALFKGTSAVEVSRPKGLSLSQLLSGVAAAVSQAYRQAVWTILEVVQVKMHSGHVYLEVSERDATGQIVAKAQATIWASTAQRILPAFEQATGATIGPGIKLLVSARPVFKAKHGFSLDIEAVDPDYTLGELEARKREIRTRLQAEGIFENNKQLAKPWDYHRVLVVAPANGAGLGDFQKEAQRLQDCGVCHFTYVFSRFQGEGSAQDLLNSLREALSDAGTGTGTATDFDAVAIIRGGGAVNDLAYLNDYGLARFVCLCPLPVLTGIGHERDNTLLDEVAHSRYDTPSKVIAGIEQTIRGVALQAQAFMTQVLSKAERQLVQASRDIEQGKANVDTHAQRLRVQSRQAVTTALTDLRLAAIEALYAPRQENAELVARIRQNTTAQMLEAKRLVPALMANTGERAASALTSATLLSSARLQTVLDRADLDTRHQAESIRRQLQATAAGAAAKLELAARASEARIREVTGQGPEKTLKRGFVVVRSSSGHTLTRAASLKPGQSIALQFADGFQQAQVVTANN